MLRIEFAQPDYNRFMFACEKVKQMARLQENDLPYNCAIDVKDLLYENVITQKYQTRYPDYNKRYADWKSKMAPGKGFWELYGHFLNALQVFKYKGGRVAGIPAGLMDKGGKSWFDTPQSKKGKPKPISWYAYLTETGFGSKPKPRPLFKYTTDNYYRSPQFNTRLWTSLNKIKWSWS